MNPADFGPKSPARQLLEPGAPGPEPVVARVRRLLRGRTWWAVALGVCLAIPLGVLGWRFGRVTYAAHSQVHVAPAGDDYGFGTAADRNGADFINYDAFIDTQMQFLHVTRVTERAMDTPDWRRLGRPISDAAARSFNQNTLISRKGEVMTIEFVDPDPAAALAGATGITEAYVQLSSETDSQRGKDKLDFLQAEVARSVNRLGELEATIKARLLTLKGHESFGVDDLLPLFAAKLTEAGALEARLRDVRWELTSRERAATAGANSAAAPVPATRPSSAAGDPGVPPDRSIDEIAMENPQMAMYLNQRREIEATLRRLEAASYSPEHPIIKTTESELEAINDAIRQFAAQYNRWRAKQGSTMFDPTSTTALRQLETNLSQSLDDTNRQLEAVARLRREVLEIREQIEQEKSNRDDLRKRIAAQDRLSRTPGRIQVMEAPSLPIEPYVDTRPRLAALGSAGGLLLGVAAMLVVGLFERRLRAPTDAARFGWGDRPVIGLLPEIPENLSDPESVARAAHSVHAIRTSLQLWYGWLEKPVFAISGAAPGTGKTTLTLALGLSFAAARSRTLLIDFDLVGGGLTRRANAVRKRPIGQLLCRAGVLQEHQLSDGVARAAAEKSLLGETLVRLGHLRSEDVEAALKLQSGDSLGVLNVLAGAELEDCVVATEAPNLSILPLGRARAHHAATVSPLAAQRLVDAARAAYDVVLIDTGPVTGSLEAAAAAAAADGVIVAVSRGDSRAAVARCSARLQSVGARLAGVVFNRATRHDIALQERDTGSSFDWSDRSDGVSDFQDQGHFHAEPWHERFGPLGRAVALAAPRVSATDQTV